MKRITKVIGGLTFEAVADSEGRVTLSAEMTEAEYAARSEAFALMTDHGWTMDVVTHGQDAVIVDAGKVWVALVSAASPNEGEEVDPGRCPICKAPADHGCYATCNRAPVRS